MRLWRCVLADLLKYIQLMEECWQQDPEKRPGFDGIATRLMAMLRWRLLASNLKQYGVSALLGVEQHVEEDAEDQHQVRLLLGVEIAASKYVVWSC